MGVNSKTLNNDNTSWSLFFEKYIAIFRRRKMLFSGIAVVVRLLGLL